jgi:hypothetical protein
MCKLNQNKWQNKNSVLLAAGTENGCILVYQLSTSSDGN